MRMLNKLAMLFVILTLTMVPSAHAVNPDEVLADPALEKRARELSTHLRCLVCQNQTIDDSDADLARDLRLLVRERLTAGDDDSQVLDYLVARYGEFVLLNPRLSVSTYLLWGTPIALILIGGFVLIVSMRKRSKRTAVPLTEEEQAALAKILDDRDQPA